MQSVKVTTQPAIEPLAVTDAKAFLRIDSTAEDDLIAELIAAAREFCEEYTRRKFISTGCTLTLDRFPYSHNEKWWDGVREIAMSELRGACDYIKLPFAPVVSVASLTSYDVDNTSAVFDSSNYSVDTVGSRIYLNQNSQWPSNIRDFNAVSIVYTAGYGATPADVPSAIRHAIKLTVAAMYDNRECFELPAMAKSALQPYRILEERSNGV